MTGGEKDGGKGRESVQRRRVNGESWRSATIRDGSDSSREATQSPSLSGGPHLHLICRIKTDAFTKSAFRNISKAL